MQSAAGMAANAGIANSNRASRVNQQNSTSHIGLGAQSEVPVTNSTGAQPVVMAHGQQQNDVSFYNQGVTITPTYVCRDDTRLKWCAVHRV